MAYSSAVTVSQVGPQEFLVVIDETGVGPSDEAVIDGLPLVGSVRRQVCVLQAGSASTVDPILDGVTGPGADGSKVLARNASPSNEVDNAGVATYPSLTQTPGGNGGRAYHRSRPDTGADNTVHTEYHVKAGW